MARHRIEIHLWLVPDPIKNGELRHKLGNFVEDLWAQLGRRGWADLSLMDERVNSLADFNFDFPARESDAAVKLVESTIKAHMMESYASFNHLKRVRSG